jgi:hypothetical protein
MEIAIDSVVDSIENYLGEVNSMGNTLRKSGIYGLVLGIAISILFINHKEVTEVSNGGYVTTYKTTFEYIMFFVYFFYLRLSNQQTNLKTSLKFRNAILIIVSGVFSVSSCSKVNCKGFSIHLC